MIVDTRTGEILDLTRLSRPPKRTRYNRPVRRYQQQRRPEPLEDLFFVVVAGLTICGTLLLFA